MTSHEREMITDLKKCNFNEINDHFKAQSEARKNKSKEEKQVRNDALFRRNVCICIYVNFPRMGCMATSAGVQT